MSQFSIIGTPLYQWETGRQLKVIPLRGMRVDSVHFSNYGDSTALVVKPKENDGVFIADIPNILLQDDMRYKPHPQGGKQRQKGGEGVDLQEIREDLMDRFPQWTV